jgi:uncharacterized protein (TIGR02677 family)
MLSRPWRSADPDLFTFTTTGLRELHVAVMAAFDDAAVLSPALNLDRLRAGIAGLGWDEPVTDEALTQALTSLVGWGLLDVSQDHSARYSTPEEFERRNLQWSLTEKGAAAIAGLLYALEELRAAVGLQTAVLDAIGDGLIELADLLRTPGSPESAGKIHIGLAQVERNLSALITSVRQFNGHLQRLLREDPTSDDVFADVKRRTVSYLEEYVEGVERPQRRLVAAIEGVAALGTATLFDRALAGANLAPVAGGDPGPEWIAERDRRWQALLAWFAPADRGAPMVGGLIDIARTAIIELLRVLERRWDSRRRSASIAHDFRALAHLFAAAPGDAEAHGLFAASFGMWSARHAHLPSVDGEGRRSTVSWLAGEPVEVAPSLRSTGTLANRGKVRPIADPSWHRARRQREQAAALAADETLRESLTTDATVRLSEFGRLDPVAFAELLHLLAVALDTAICEDGTRRGLSSDGSVEVILRDDGLGRIAVLDTDDGRLSGPDLVVSITLTQAALDRRQATGG